MPKEITHWLIATDAFLSLADESPIKIAVSQNINLYYTSAVLPDTPYYYLGGKGKGIKEAADTFHQRARNSFRPFLRILKQPAILPFPQELSFIAGITSHIMVDSTFHPTISALSDVREKDTPHDPVAIHRQLETALDLWYLTDKQIPINDRVLKDYVANLETTPATICKVLGVFFGMPPGSDQLLLQKALKHHSFCQTIFQHRNIPRVLQFFNTIIPHRLDLLLSLFYDHPHNFPSHLPPALAGLKTLIGLRKTAEQRTTAALTFMGNCRDREELYEGLRIIKGPNLVTGQTE